MNSVLCGFFLGKIDKMLPKPGLVNQFSGTPRGQRNWTGPIANSSAILRKQTSSDALMQGDAPEQSKLQYV